MHCLFFMHMECSVLSMKSAEEWMMSMSIGLLFLEK